MPNTRRSTLDQLTVEQREFVTPGGTPLVGLHTPPKGSRVADPATAHGVPLRSVTFRLTPETAATLRRVAAERAICYREPFSQQAIAEQALRQWLEENDAANPTHR